MAVEVEEKPLPSWGKAVLTLNVLLALSCWLMVAYFYPRLPDVVPTHFDWEGKPTSWGPKSHLFLVIPAVATGVVSSTSLLVLLRFKIIKRYPYLISIPALSLALGSPRVPPDVRGSIINRAISFTLVPISLVAALMTFLTFELLRSALEASWRPIRGLAVVASVLALAAATIASSFVYYRMLYLEVRRYAT
jgi:hypothetical protein